MSTLAGLALFLIVVRWLAQLGLEFLNRSHVQAHADKVPEAFRGVIDAPTYTRAVAYTLAKNRLAMAELTWSTLVVVVVLFSGLLPAAWQAWGRAAGDSVWASAAGLFLGGAVLAIPGLPLEWWSQFRLEERFGFNTSTQFTWWMDRAKGLVLGGLLGLPLLALILFLVSWAGPTWWLWGWGALVAFQVVMLVLAPVVILPLFNKFEPLTAGALRDRLTALAQRTGFRNRGIEVMDGSRRSRHANAFFTGLGRFRKIVLFDTLLAQMGEDEIEAVLAHEIGHYRRRHVPKLLAWSLMLSFAAFAVIAWLAGEPEFFRAFGFSGPSVPVALLLFGLLADPVTFWLTPVGNALSRRFEFQADAFAAEAVGSPAPLVSALRKLHEKNLSNLTPHPLYSRFHYSHPTLLEREAALEDRGVNPGATMPSAA